MLLVGWRSKHLSILHIICKSTLYSSFFNAHFGIHEPHNEANELQISAIKGQILRHQSNNK